MRYSAIFLILLIIQAFFQSCSLPSAKLTQEDIKHYVSNLPDGWDDETAVILKDSTHIYPAKLNYRDCLVSYNVAYIMINKRFPNIFETVVISESENIETKPKFTVQAYYPNGSTWSSTPLGTRRKRAESDFFPVQNIWNQWIEIPKYQEGIVIRKEVKRFIYRPEFDNQDIMRRAYHVLERKIRFSLPNDFNIRFGFTNAEHLAIDSQVNQGERQRDILFSAQKLKKIDSENRLKKPEEWYAGLYYSFPPKGKKTLTWQELGDYYLQMVEPALATSPAISHLAAKITATHKDSIINQAFRLLRHRIRYHADEKKIYAIVPRPASRIFEKGLGDCKEMSSLLKVLLNEKGIESHLTLTNSPGKFQLREEFPSLGNFDHMILYVENKDRTGRFIDLTVNFGTPENSFLHLNRQKALVLSPAASRVTTINAEKRFLNRVVTKSAILNTDNGWTLSGDIELHGLAAYNLFPLLKNMNQEENASFMRIYLKEMFNLKIQSFELEESSADVIKISCKADFNKAYLNMDKGGILLDAPSLFGGHTKYTTLKQEGPRFFETIEQSDKWQVPAGFRDFEKVNISHPIATGNWSRSGKTVQRSFHVNRTLVSNDERKSLEDYFSIRKKFSRAAVWKK